MMLTISIFICIANIIINFINKKNKIEPLFLFSCIWLGVLFLYKLRLFGMPELSFEVKVVVFVAIIMFTIGVCFARHIVLHKQYSNNNQFEIIDISHQWIIMLELIAICIFLYGAVVDVMGMLSGLKMSYYRYNILPQIRTPLYLSMIMYIANPIFYIAIVYNIYMIVTKKNSKGSTALFGILFLIAILYSGGGRFPFLLVITSLWVVFWIVPHRKLRKKTKRKIILSSVLMVCAVIGISVLRGSSWIEELYCYSVCGLPNLDVHIKLFKSEPEYCNGLLSLQGFFRPLYLIMRSMGNELIAFVDKAYYLIDQRMYIEGMGTINSTVTMMMYFYYDGGVFGVGLFSFLFGFISQKIYGRYCKEKTLSKLLEYVIVAFYILVSFIHIGCAHIEWAFTFYWIFFIRKLTHNIRNDNI